MPGVKEPDFRFHRQLYLLSSPHFRAPNYVGHDGRLHTVPADNVPLMMWPDGGWCSQANSFIREAFERGLSRRNYGGTLSVMAAHLSLLIRYCWNRRVDFSDLTDDQFREFVTELSDARRHRDPGSKRRNANGVIAIGRTCLSFLNSLANQLGDDEFIGPAGRIRVIQRVGCVSGRTTDGQRVKRSVIYWDHAAFPKASPKKKRMPVGQSQIDRLRESVGNAGGSTHLRMRRHVTLKLLETTGARRGEIALLTLASVLDAASMELPMLLIPTLKRRGGDVEPRFVPLSRTDIMLIAQYAQVHRRAVMRRRRSNSSDHGFLLVSDTSGEPLRPNSITQEIRFLARSAGISQPLCPHMFRHRFITKLFVTLIEHHEIANPDEFRRALLDGEALKRKVSEWTGHKSMASLERYINLAFDEVSKFKRTFEMAHVNLALDAFTESLNAEIDVISSPIHASQLVDRLRTYVAELRSSIFAAASGSADGHKPS